MITFIFCKKNQKLNVVLQNYEKPPNLQNSKDLAKCKILSSDC